MLNKTDKYFLISTLIIPAALILPIILIYTCIALEIDLLVGISFALSLISYTIIVPISLIAQFITLFIKIFSPHKNKKDWIILILNFCTVIFFTCLILFLFYAALTL